MMGDDIDSMLNEDEKHIETEELREERERAGRRRGGKALPVTPLGMDEDVGILGDLAPAELEPIDHHAEAARLIEEKLILPSSSAGSQAMAGKKKISGQARLQPRVNPASTKGTSSTKKQNERYSKG